jgi:hypothetical protein
MGAPKVDQAYVKAVAAARKDIQTMLDKEKSTPIFIRLAFSDALTFDKATNTGGANGSIRQVLFTVTMPLQPPLPLQRLRGQGSVLESRAWSMSLLPCEAAAQSPMSLGRRGTRTGRARSWSTLATRAWPLLSRC